MGAVELQDVIAKRKSVRKFQQKDVPDDLLNKLMLTAAQGPSAGGIRGFKGIITREKLVYDAPVYVVICIDESLYEQRYGERGKNLYAIQDSAIFGAYMTLLLVDEGLSCVWVGAFREGRIKRTIGTELRPLAILAIGYEKEPESAYETCQRCGKLHFIHERCN